MFGRLGKHCKFSVMILISFGLLVGCKSAEERAADAFVQAVQLMEAGDVSRAGVAFQNVFKYAPSNLEAREIYAGFLRSTGNSTEAAGQYLRYLEQRPGHLPALVAMTELAMESYRWDVAQTNLVQAQDIAPGRQDIAALGKVMDYVLAVGAGNDGARDTALSAMADTVRDVPLLPVSRALADGALRRDDPEAALIAIDDALQVWPKDRPLHDDRLLSLRSLAQPEAVAAQFRDMIDLFPESPDIAAQYVDWLSRNDQIDTAEDFLRRRSDSASDQIARTLDLIEFLAVRKGPDAVLEDLDALVDSETSPLLFRAMRATVIFQTNSSTDAIADLKQVIDAADTSTDDAIRDDADRYRVVLAGMLDQIGDRAAAESTIAPVVLQHPNMADAALLQARFQLENGRNTEAITTLRAALGADESDPHLLLLLARAHAAMGAPALAGRTLALAASTSGHSPETALAFAAHLQADGRIDPAIDVLTRALTDRPNHPVLLASLGALYTARADWDRAGKIARTLRDLNEGAVADQLDLTVLAGRATVDEAVGMIADQDPSDRVGTMAYLTLIRAFMAAGNTDAAWRVLDLGLERAPDNTLLQAVSAKLALTDGQGPRAIQTYRALLSQDPSSEYLWVSLARAVSTGESADPVAALDVVRDGLAALPDSLRLGWERAMLLQQADRADEAIVAYEDLLLRAPENLPALNNLANLLSTARQDDASLMRAADLGRVLERSEVPQFRNTLGWIRLRQGNVSGAVDLLVPAAEALADDTVAQIQAAEALLAAGKTDRARTFAARALDLADPASELADRARTLQADIAAYGLPNEG